MVARHQDGNWLIIDHDDAAYRGTCGGTYGDTLMLKQTGTQMTVDHAMQARSMSTRDCCRQEARHALVSSRVGGRIREVG